MSNEITFKSPVDGNTYILRPDPKYEFLRTDPWPTQEQLASIYEDYDNPTPAFNEFRFKSLLNDRLALLDKPRKICEIGCGAGGLLKIMKEDGHDVFGFEPGQTDYNAAKAKGLKIHQEFFDPDLMAKEEKQDIIILINVLEHVPEPKNFLMNIKKYLAKKTGYILILVPNEFNPFQNLIMEDQTDAPYFLGPPIHLSYFTPETIEHLVRDAGFDITHRTTDFPMELFALSGRNYLEEPSLGPTCHQERVKFEQSLIKNPDLFWQFYDALAKINLGREIILVAKVSE